MIAKFEEAGDSQKIMEVQNLEEGVQFYIYDFMEEMVGQHFTLPRSKVQDLLRYIQSGQLHQ